MPASKANTKQATKTAAEVAVIAQAVAAATPAPEAAKKPAKERIKKAASKALEPHTVGGDAPAELPAAGTGAKARKEATTKPGKVVVSTPDAPAPVASADAKSQPKGKPKGKATKKVAATALPLPAVYKDEHNHTAIVVAEGRKYVQLIPMDAAGLAVTRVSRDQFAAKWGKHMADYPVGKAAAQYLAGNMVVTPQAKELLDVLAKAQADKPLASGQLVALMSKGDEKADPDSVVPQPLEAATKGDKPARQPAASKPGKKAEGDKAPKAARTPAVYADAGKTIAVGKVAYAEKVRAGTFRFALMEALVKGKGKKVSDLLGATVMDGKPGIAKVDVEFAVKQGYITLA